MKLAIGNDHAATEMKFEIMKYLESKGHEVINYGTDTLDRFDYPIAGYKVGKAVANGEVDFGICICGTGIGISLAANKVHGIRAAVVSETYSARYTRYHNDANVICFGSRVVGLEVAKDIVDAFLGAEYEGGRHQRRIDMLKEIEETQHLKAAEE